MNENELNTQLWKLGHCWNMNYQLQLFNILITLKKIQMLL